MFVVIAVTIVNSKEDIGDLDLSIISVSCLSDGSSQRRTLIYSDPSQQCDFERARRKQQGYNYGYYDGACSTNSYQYIWTGIRTFANCQSSTTNFEVHSSSVKAIPKYVFQQFTSIMRFEMKDQNLKFITEEDFKNAEQLNTLILSGNDLQEFPTSIFKNIPAIQSIDLSFNELTSLSFYGRQTIINLLSEDSGHVPTNLQDLILSNNKLTSIPIGLAQLPKLRQISLSHNCIKKVDFDSFPFLTLSNLFLKNNQIVEVYNSERLLSTNLTDFTISNNPIMNTQISSNALKIDLSRTNISVCRISTRTTQLSATNNVISEIVVQPEAQLTHLNLSTNLITSALNLSLLHNLISLDLSRNLLTEIYGDVFKSMSQLSHLVLFGNQLKKLDLGPLDALIYLDISYNYLQKFEFKDSLPELQDLHIEGNNLKVLNTNLKTKAPQLKNIGINDNNYECNHLTNSLILLQFDGLKLVDNGNGFTPSRTNFTTNVKGIGCYYKETDNIEERVTRLEAHVSDLMKMLYAKPNNQLPLTRLPKTTIQPSTQPPTTTESITEVPIIIELISNTEIFLPSPSTGLPIAIEKMDLLPSETGDVSQSIESEED